MQNGPASANQVREPQIPSYFIVTRLQTVLGRLSQDPNTSRAQLDAAATAEMQQYFDIAQGDKTMTVEIKAVVDDRINANYYSNIKTPRTTALHVLTQYNCYGTISAYLNHFGPSFSVWDENHCLPLTIATENSALPNVQVLAKVSHSFAVKEAIELHNKHERLQAIRFNRDVSHATRDPIRLAIADLKTKANNPDSAANQLRVIYALIAHLAGHDNYDLAHIEYVALMDTVNRIQFKIKQLPNPDQTPASILTAYHRNQGYLAEELTDFLNAKQEFIALVQQRIHFEPPTAENEIRRQASMKIIRNMR